MRQEGGNTDRHIVWQTCRCLSHYHAANWQSLNLPRSLQVLGRDQVTSRLSLNQPDCLVNSGEPQKMRPTPPSPSQDETSPHQSNGRAHSDGSAANPPPTAIASTERSTNTNDATSESDEDGIASRSSLNHSPNDTLLALGERLNRQRQQADVAPIDNSNIAPSPSPFRHSIMNSNTTSLTSANLLNSALLERRRFSTPANPEDAGNRTPSTATTGLTTSDEGWERMRRSRGPTPSSVMGQQGSTETGEGDDGGRSNGHATDGDTSSVDNTAPATSPSPENLENPPLERRVYTDADLREIRTSASSITPTSSTEGWERVRLRYPPPPNYRNANLDGSSDTRDDSNAAPPPPTEGWEIVKRRPRIPPPPATTTTQCSYTILPSQPTTIGRRTRDLPCIWAMTSSFHQLLQDP